MAQKIIFFIVTCDEWCSYSSWHLRMLTTDDYKVRDYIRKAIEDDECDYYDSMMPKEMQVEHFLEDWDKEKHTVVQSRLKYMFYDYSYDGEEL